MSDENDKYVKLVSLEENEVSLQIQIESFDFQEDLFNRISLTHPSPLNES